MAERMLGDDARSPKIVGILPSGMDRQVAKAAGTKIKQVFQDKGDEVSVRSLRFIPSSFTKLDDDTFQVVANTTLEADRNQTHPRATRARVVDSIVTLGRKEGKLVFRNATVPSLPLNGPRRQP